MFYLTGVFYNLEKRAGEIGVYLNQYNPLAFLINAARDALIYCKMPNLLWVSLWLIIGMILSAVGIRSVSYTHLDVYKRQIYDFCDNRCSSEFNS